MMMLLSVKLTGSYHRTMYFLTNAALDMDASLLPQVNMTVDLPSKLRCV